MVWKWKYAVCLKSSCINLLVMDSVINENFVLLIVIIYIYSTTSLMEYL